jgi:hypothetical protein
MSPIKFNIIALTLVSLLISGCGKDNDKQIPESALNIAKENKVTVNIKGEDQVRKRINMTYIIYWKEDLVENKSRFEELKKVTELNIKSVKTRKNIDVILVEDNLSPHDIKQKINNSGMVNQVVQEQLITTQ